MDMEDPFAAAGDGNDPFQSVEAPGDDYNAIQDPQAAAPADAGDMKTGDVFGGVQAGGSSPGNPNQTQQVTTTATTESQGKTSTESWEEIQSNHRRSTGSEISFQEIKTPPITTTTSSNPATTGTTAPPEYTQDAGNDAEEENVTFLSVWEEQRAKTLQERQQKEEAAKQEIAKTATQEIQKHLEERKEQITQNQKDNRAAEADFKEDMEKVFKDGTIWQQVGKMVSLKADGGGRPERMRDILIQLKNAKS